LTAREPLSLDLVLKQKTKTVYLDPRQGNQRAVLPRIVSVLPWGGMC
jgi:hypothetical protein